MRGVAVRPGRTSILEDVVAEGGRLLALRGSHGRQAGVPIASSPPCHAISSEEVSP